MFALRGISTLRTPVGYSNRALTANVQEMSSGDFVGVAAQEFTLDELTMTGDKIKGSTIRWMLPGGAFQTAIWAEIWFNEKGEEMDYGDDDAPVGWTDAANPEHPIHYTFKPGEGFFVKPVNGSLNPKLVSSGALYTCDASIARVGVQLTANVQEITSNPMPGSTLALDDITMSGDKIKGSTIRWMLPGGAFQTAIWAEIWFNEKGEEMDYGDDDAPVGWTDAANPEHPIHYNFKAGESYFVKPVNGSITPYIRFPNPLYVAPAAD